ncbi:MAG TPA: gamma-glutamyltransferase family protein [Steroidobacteraceae bacterium]|nr:gamma-glutamyltransferase family protein [Steroidobacteraceae bacterium]
MPTSRRPARRGRMIALLLLGLGVGACRTSPTPPPPGSPSPAAASALRAGVTAAHPLAVDAGLEVLRKGGSAADAAVAVQAALGLVEPQSSGLGGGAFMLHYDAETRTVTAFNGRETAPAAATPDMFLDDTGAPLPYPDAVTSGRATGVPGAVAMLGAAHARFGRLPWRELFDVPIRAAEQGFVVPQRLGRFANSTFTQATLPDARALFTKPDGTLVQAGDTLRNPAYAATLRTIAERGPRALLEGPLAEQIVARTREAPRPGALTVADLAGYEPRVTPPLCKPFRLYVVCVPPPPSSGVSLLELLGLLERTDIGTRGPSDPRAWLLFVEASRLMYADRDQYVADPRYVAVPVEGLLDPRYLDARASLIGDRAAAVAPMPGTPPGASMTRAGRDATLDVAGTSHFVVVDAAGDVVSVTTSVESLFGSGRAVGGFFLNNQLTDFSFKSVDDAGNAVANAVAGGKQPRSSMAPVIVLEREDGDFVAALGSPGGSAILAYNAKALVGLLLWDLPLQQAFDLPNVIARGTEVFGEAAKLAPEVVQGLGERGVVVKPGRGEESGLHGVALRGPARFEGAADRRREGVWREQ